MAAPEQKDLRVNLAERSYTIRIGGGILAQCAKDFSAAAKPGAMFALTNSSLVKTLAPLLKQIAGESSLPVVSIPDGEEHKDLAHWEGVLAWMLKNRFDRKAVLVAFGGGVIGDMGGFAASVYLRGIRYVQVPTTLLAMVDSSVGGKTAVNHELGKNLIGTFWQPSEVWIDINALDTLPEREFRAGMAEVVKYAFIGGREFFDWVESSIDPLLKRDPGTLIEGIERSCRFKASVVEKDEREGGLRAILNYGHTFGHAIESIAGYGTLRHGEAINYGMRAAAELGLALGKVDEAFVARHHRLCSLLEPPPLPKLRVADLMEAMLHDKKVQDAKIKLVLPNGYGAAEVVNGINANEIQAAWSKVLG